MNSNKQLELINKEDLVWYIYYFIVTFALITNELERKYIIYKDENSKKIAQKINTFILIIAFFIYLYFLSSSFDNITNSNTSREKRIGTERLIVNILFVIAGAIAIYADYDDNSANIDIGIL